MKQKNTTTILLSVSLIAVGISILLFGINMLAASLLFGFGLLLNAIVIKLLSRAPKTMNEVFDDSHTDAQVRTVADTIEIGLFSLVAFGLAFLPQDYVFGTALTFLVVLWRYAYWFLTVRPHLCHSY